MFDKNSQGGQSQQFAAGTSPSHSEIPSKHDVPGLVLLPRQSSTNPSPPLAERNSTALSVGAQPEFQLLSQVMVQVITSCFGVLAARVPSIPQISDALRISQHLPPEKPTHSNGG